MKFFIILSALAAVALAKPSYPHVVAPLAYAHYVSGAPIGPDGRVVDTPEVAHAKAAHTAAHINEKVTLANEAVKSADVVAYSAGPAIVSAYSAAPAVISSYAAAPLAWAHAAHGAPTGVDGRVVDTAEVAHAKAEHAAAHINEKITLANEAAKSYAAYTAPAVVAAYSAPAVLHAAYSAPAVVPAAYSAYAPAVVSAYSAYHHAAPAVVSAYSSLSHHHHVVPSVSVW